MAKGLGEEPLIGKGSNCGEMIVAGEILLKTEKDLLRGRGGVVEAGWRSRFGVEESMNGEWRGGYKWTILWVAEKGGKNTRKKAQKLENEGEGRRMKVIPPPQEALTRKQWNTTKDVVGKPVGLWWELVPGERSRRW
jgi:hypothetical protein